MSQIATALAKAKERPATQAPFMVGAGGRPAAVTPPKKSYSNFIWGIVLVLAIAGITVVFLMQKAADKNVQELASPTLAQTDLPTTTSVANAGNGTIPVTPQLSLAAMTVRYNKNEASVRSLNISAVLPGEQPRVMANGKVYQVGDVIIAPDITFAGTENGLLIFSDQHGNRFSRRF